jgi:N-acetylglucosaminyldiphosphoundecaprenol N-acetyl-beta-D-mannosaminyltransferase
VIAPVSPSIRLAGVRIDTVDLKSVVARIIDYVVEGTGSGYVVTPNAQHVVLHQKDSRFREIYENAFLVVPDGVPLLWAARLLGLRLSGRVNGTDLFEALCAEAAERELRVFFLGGREGAAIAAADRLRARHPSLKVCGLYCPPFGFESDPDQESRIVEQINAAQPHVLFVGLGAPKQEYWMYAHRNLLRVPMSLGIGVSFEFVGGLVKRAPLWMQRSGLEWLFRLFAEPKRLWRRYVLGNTHFCALVVREFLSLRR